MMHAATGWKQFDIVAHTRSNVPCGFLKVLIRFSLQLRLAGGVDSEPHPCPRVQLCVVRDTEAEIIRAFHQRSSNLQLRLRFGEFEANQYVVVWSAVRVAISLDCKPIEQ